MNTPAPPERSLLVKSAPGRAAPYVLEDLRTGARREFSTPPALLAALSKALTGQDPPVEGDRS